MQLPSNRWRFVHLTALWGYGVSQPIFSLLDRNPEFLVFNGASRADILTFALLVVCAPPLVVLVMELVAGAFLATPERSSTCSAFGRSGSARRSRFSRGSTRQAPGR